jgi:antitoxin component YwqK of YwqJK toxin-antitoxin module
LLSTIINAESSIKTMHDIQNVTKTKIKKSILHFGGINKYIEGMAKGFNDKIKKQKAPEMLSYNHEIVSSSSRNNTLTYKIIMDKNLFIEETRNLSEKTKKATKKEIEKVIYTNQYKTFYNEEFKSVNVKRYCSIEMFKALFEETMILDFLISFDDGEIYTTFSIDNTDCMNSNISMTKPSPEIRTIYYDTGEIKIKMRFVNSKMNGITKSYYKNGKLETEINYKNDKFHGVSKIYHQNGNIKSKVIYKNGKKLSYISYMYYPNKKIKAELSYKNNKLSGLSKTFHKNGALASETNYINNKAHGIVTEYFSDGNLQRKVNYKFGKFADGDFMEYYKNGKLKYQEYYEDNKLKQLRHFYKNGVLKKEASYNKNMNGKITTYNEKGIILKMYVVKNGKVFNKK